LFVNRVGPTSLFYIYLGSSLVSLALSFALARVIDKYSRKMIFFASFLVLGAIVLSTWGIIHFLPGWKPVYFAVRILSYSVLVLTGTLFWVLASLTFSHADSKKIFSRFVVAAVLGEMMGGLFTGFAAKWIGTEHLLLAWGLFLCAIPFIFLRFPFPRPETPGFSTGVIWGEVQAPGSGYRSRAFFSSRLIQLLLIFWVAYSFVCYGGDYIYNSYVVERIHGEDALTEFFGRVSAAGGVAILFYYLVISPKISHRFSPTHSLFLACGLIAIPWIAFTIHPSLVTIAIVDCLIFYFSDHFVTGVYSSILTVFPERVKGRIRLLTEGYGRPLGIILLFSVAAVFSFHVSLGLIHYLVLGVTLLLFSYPLWFHKPYQRHLMNCLQSRDPSLVLNAVEALGESPQFEAIEPLTSLLSSSKSFSLRRSVVHTLEQMRSPEALQKVLPVISNPEDPLHASAIAGLKNFPNYQAIFVLIGLLKKDREKDPHLRRIVLQVLKKSLHKGVVPFLMDLLHEEDGQAQGIALETLAGFKERSMIPILLPYLKSPDSYARAGACIALYPFKHTREKVRELALAEIEKLANADHVKDRIAGFKAIGTCQLKSFRELLAEGLDSSDPSLKLGAAVALAKCGDPRFLETFIRLMLDGNEGFAKEVYKNIVELPQKSRKTLFEKIQNLRDVEQMKIGDRLRKNRYDFSEEWSFEEERLPVLSN